MPEPATTPVGGALKRAFDLAVAIPVAVVLSPLMLALALWVRRDSPGPAVFRQERIGFAGRPFRLWKFRTMVVGAERMGSGLRVEAGDERITRAGRFLRATSLDELPQLANVILGDMSLVGPRPTVAWQVERYDERQRLRLEARPGVTGLAQVRGLGWVRRRVDAVEVSAGRKLACLVVVLGRKPVALVEVEAVGRIGAEQRVRVRAREQHRVLERVGAKHRPAQSRMRRAAAEIRGLACCMPSAMTSMASMVPARTQSR